VSVAPCTRSEVTAPGPQIRGLTYNPVRARPFIQNQSRGSEASFLYPSDLGQAHD
jgi:hypothetical protein